MLEWLKRESLATLAMLGAALTVLAQLRQVMPMAPWLTLLIDYWQQALHGFWRPLLGWLGAPLHPDLLGALTVAVFMILIGVGARVAARRTAASLAPMATIARSRDGMNWPSVLVFAALVIVFLLGHKTPAGDPLELWGSREAGKSAFAIAASAGFLAGEYLGHYEFDRRLLRLAVLVPLLVAASLATQWYTARGG